MFSVGDVALESNTSGFIHLNSIKVTGGMYSSIKLPVWGKIDMDSTGGASYSGNAITFQNSTSPTYFQLMDKKGVNVIKADVSGATTPTVEMPRVLINNKVAWHAGNLVTSTSAPVANSTGYTTGDIWIQY